MALRKNKKPSGPSAIGELLTEFFQSAMPPQMRRETQIFREWSKVVGSDIAKQAQPKSFRNGILFVETRHPSWTMELQARRHLIRGKLNTVLGEELVKDIHFRQARL